MSDNIVSAAPAQRAQLRKTLTLVPVVMINMKKVAPEKPSTVPKNIK